MSDLESGHAHHEFGRVVGIAVACVGLKRPELSLADTLSGIRIQQEAPVVVRT